MTGTDKAIKRSRHATATLEEPRHDFNGIKIFSAVDQNCSYNQYSLPEGERRDNTVSQMNTVKFSGGVAPGPS